VTETAVLDGFAITAGKADGNYPHGDGGGMYNDGGSPTLTNVTFSGNSAGYGGGMYNYSSNPALTNITFSGNSATEDGGGMHNSFSNPMLTNVTFSSNSAVSDGGGVYNSYNSSPTLINCILWGNEDNGGTDQSAQIYLTATNPVTVAYSLVQGGVYTGTGNISVDPEFVRDPDPGDGDWSTLADNDYGDLSLLPSSPAIDKGDNSALPADVTDLDGDGNTSEPIPIDLARKPRIIGNVVDMGAYEWSLQVFLPLVLRSSN
jgi:hypothetical protein